MRRFLLVLLIVPVLSGLAPSVWAAGLFGMIEIKANSIESIPKWVDALRRINLEGLLAKCRAGNCKGRQQDWYEMIQDVRREGRFNQMVMVNRWLNRYKYITDDRQWGVSDYWETPGQFVETSGDCEDYAIAKFYSLKALGWSDEDLRLVVLRDKIRDIPHAVLAATYNGDNYILDNLSTEPLQDKYIQQYTPYYAVNSTSRWVFIQPMQ